MLLGELLYFASWGVSLTDNHHYELHDDTTSCPRCQSRTILCWGKERKLGEWIHPKTGPSQWQVRSCTLVQSYPTLAFVVYEFKLLLLLSLISVLNTTLKIINYMLILKRIFLLKVLLSSLWDLAQLNIPLAFLKTV